ncbi:MAG: ImmA/IrrE family metallo-endopeptidase [Terriglobia bacterium]
MKKGEKALTLCIPLVCKRTRTITNSDGSQQDEQFTFARFTYKNNWFVLSRTEGAEFRAPAIPEWNEQKALEALKIERVPFEDLDGNVQGYAKRGGKIAVSSIAALLYKTLFHEIAHALLRCEEGDLADTEITPRDAREVEAEAVALLCCESRGLPGAEFRRGCRSFRHPDASARRFQSLQALQSGKAQHDARGPGKTGSPGQ